MERWIMHVDMDAFFAAVEQRDRPELAGLPVAVAGPVEHRGVVSTASYEARRYGVRSAMPTATAVRLCPDLVIVRPDHHRYAAVSREIMAVFHRFTSLVEPLSLDEAFLDVTGLVRSVADASSLGQQVQSDVRTAVSLSCSVGLGPNKLIAKIASDFRKPAGLTVVGPSDAYHFLTSLPVRSLWGVGEKTSSLLGKLGVTTIAELRQLPLHTLEKLLGKMGAVLHAQARGLDDRAVEPVREAQTIGREVTFPADLGDIKSLTQEVAWLGDEVARGLRRRAVLASHLTLKLKYYDFKLVTRSKRLPAPTCLAPEITSVAVELLRDVWRGAPVRLIGISCGKLMPLGTGQVALFGDERQRRMRLASIGDDLARRTGVTVLPAGEMVRKGKDGVDDD